MHTTLSSLKPSSFPAAIGFVFVSLLLPRAAYPQAFFPVSQVKAGLHGTGRTVFSGNRIEEFQVDILGVLRNFGPGQNIVLARLSGGPLAQTGILQGMSGSPVYIEGKLLGAVALGFPFSKEPICGIQPIEQMIGTNGPAPALAATPPRPPAVWAFFHNPSLSSLGALLSAPVASPFGNLSHLGIPLSFSGFTAASLQTVAADFRTLGFAPAAGLAPPQANSPNSPAPAAPSLRPGAMISVGLLTGDLNMTADGTVTYIDGQKLYAFGHRFLDTGSVEMPFAQSDVMAVVPSLNSSFKLSTPGRWIGTIVSDRSTAISGEIGRSPHTVPLEVTVDSQATGAHIYHFQVVNDRFLTPFITQAALLSVLDSTERSLGRGTLQLTGRAEWDGNLAPLDISGTFVSDSGVIQQAATDAVVPLGFVLGSGFQDIRLKKLAYHLKANESKQMLHLAQAWTDRHDIRPGETLQITTLLEGENGFQVSRTLPYRVPIGASTGALNLTVSDGTTLNYPEFASLSQSSLHASGDLIRAINSFRDNDALYVRIWRPQPSFTVSNSSATGELNDPPPSIALVLSDPSNSATSNTLLAQTRGSQIDELSSATPGYVVTGAKTLQVEVKER